MVVITKTMKDEQYFFHSIDCMIDSVSDELVTLTDITFTY